jgi:chitodextrinase
VNLGRATLEWQASAASDIAGYRVYYGTGSGSYLQARGQGVWVTATTLTVDGLQSATRYYFAVTAVDMMGNESPYSAEASKLLS